MAVCKSCGTPIIWVETAAKKMMPCETEMVFYRSNSQGEATILTKDGVTIRADILPTFRGAEGQGYVPHWTTCKKADFHRRGGRYHGSKG